MEKEYDKHLHFINKRDSVLLNILAVHPDHALVKTTNLFSHSAPNIICVNSKGV
jgi:hypothetical protein